MDAKNLKTSVSKLVIQLTASINLTSGSGYARNFDGCAYKWEQEGLGAGKEETKVYELDLFYALRNAESKLPTSMTPEVRKMGT